MYYFFVEDNKINGKGQCRQIGENVLNFEVPKEMYEDDIEKFIYKDEQIILDPNYEEKQRQKERKRLDMLSLTRGDVFIGLIQARMIDENTLRAQLEQMPEETDEQKMQKMLALNALSNALNFHRGHDLVNVIGAQLGISQENLDKFFEENDYHYLEEAAQPGPAEYDQEEDEQEEPEPDEE